VPLSLNAHRADFAQRISSIRTLLRETHPPGLPASAVAREIRGLSIVLLYAAYEQLLYGLCRALLETASTLHVGNRRLRPGLQVFAALSDLQAVASGGPGGIWKGQGLRVAKTLAETRQCTIASNAFPSDGSHMRRDQVKTVCELFGLKSPDIVLREVWGRLDTIVDERNGVAHGRLTADQVGRTYTIGDLNQLVDLWESRWGDFIDMVEVSAAGRDFFRYPR
jgi:hypothetical protein